MRIIISTPLYPPDIAEPAPYTKELARRLSASHDVIIVTYGRVPEEVPGVKILVIDKRKPLLPRLFSYTLALLREARLANIIYLQNGASTELPAGIVARLTRIPLVAHIGDAIADEKASKSVILRALQKFAFSRAQTILTETPPPHHEVLHFEGFPAAALSAYEASWKNHLKQLERQFSYGK